jgi:hypothetical protein
MDLYCPFCAEPYDLETLREEADYNDLTFTEVRAAFYERGCEALGGRHNAPVDTAVTAGISTIYQLLGDDVDGAVVEVEDFMLAHRD